MLLPMYKERFISGLIGSMFIIIFQPFGLLAFGNYRWVIIAGICACIMASIFLTEIFLTWALRMPHCPQRGMKYLIRRNVLFQVLNIVGMTVSTVLFLDRFGCMEGVDNHLSWGTLLNAFLCYLGCSIIIGLYWRNVYMKRDYQRQLEEAQYFNGILQERQRKLEEPLPAPAIEEAPVRELTLSGTTKESLTLLPEDFVHAEANGNYVHVHYLKEGDVKDIMLRCGITQVEEAFLPHPNIMRCHRAFVVNLKHVSKLENHGSTLQLFFRVTKALIPVSKTYIQTVKERIIDPME